MENQSFFNRFILLYLLMNLVLLIYSPLSKAQAFETGSRISWMDAQSVLDHHNKVRKEVGVNQLVWDTSLSAYAQRWANYLAESENCKLIHRSDNYREGKLYGENLYWGSSAVYYSPLSASESWYSEKKLYEYKRIDDSNWSKVGHYTQMVWRNTVAVGVGVATCASGGIIVVANYFPPGNYLGEFPY